MKNRNFSFINMSGNKRALASKIFSQLLEPIDCGKYVYVEPFFGAGGAYCNLPYTFKEYRCSDIFPYVIGFVNSQFSKELLIKFYDKVFEKWNLFEREDYFLFRSFWNQNQADPKSFIFKYGGFVLLANSCINGMIRFGPGGFNQAWGNRAISRESFASLNDLVKLSSTFQVFDFRDVSYPKDSITYFDPPYRGTGALNEMTGFYSWTQKEDEDLIELVKSLNCKWILSTLQGSYLQRSLDQFRNFTISKKYKMAPSARMSKDHVELVISNIEGDKHV